MQLLSWLSLYPMIWLSLYSMIWPNVNISHGGSFNLKFRNLPDDNHPPTLKKNKSLQHPLPSTLCIFDRQTRPRTCKLQSSPSLYATRRNHLRKLCNNREFIGGLRIEASYTAMSLGEALNASGQHRPDNMNTFYQNYHLSCYYLQRDRFLTLIASLRSDNASTRRGRLNREKLGRTTSAS